jgi:hypothetical protein
MSTARAPRDSYILLWVGENPAFHETLLEELQSADLSYTDKPLGEGQVAPTADPLPIDFKPRFGFEVAVPSRQYSVARQIVEKLLDEGELADVEIPAGDETAPENHLANAQEDEPATVNVWAGGDRQSCRFITAALRENAIPIHVQTESGHATVFVPTSQAARAREIVREITQGAPPE